MIDTDKYEGHTPAPWVFHPIDCAYRDSFCKSGRAGTCGCWYCESKRNGMSIQSGSKHDLPWTIVVNELHMGHQDSDGANAQLIVDSPLLLEEVKRAREIVPKLSRLIGVEIPWIEHDHPITNGIFIGEAVEWDYDSSGEWVLVNYNETRWVTMSYIEAHNVPKYIEQVGLKEMIELLIQTNMKQFMSGYGKVQAVIQVEPLRHSIGMWK